MLNAELNNLEALLLNASGNVPLHDRFRALFTLKALKSEQAVVITSQKDPSALLKHELAYCLDQMKNAAMLSTLESVLADEREDPMIRHEPAEAVSAISSASSLPVLKKYLNASSHSVRETCEIALAKIEWDHSEEGRRHHQSTSDEPQTHTSVDPAPPTSGRLATKVKSGNATKSNVEDLRSILLDTQVPLFDRYRAMFALRSIGTAAAVDALAGGFSDDSALFKHEIAFVLQNPHESDMVRHEAAEFLGGIATPEDYTPVVVRESCQVALGMYEYENSDQFQYANGLNTTQMTEASVSGRGI
ncbi:deoxyhypusine hydroxylase [Lactifluus subvellereus]|nr:deoxyhypusine hydroxylase [Lactifluus subvellereus]